jgi:hypothetical protein
MKKLKKIARWCFANLLKSDFVRYVLKHPHKTLKAIFFWIMETWPRRLLASLVIIVLIFGPISFLFKPGKAEAAWWNDSWAYRKSIQITNNTTQQTNVYVTVSLDTSDTTKFKTTCGDLRFTQVNGKVMPYYLVSGCGTGSTSILVAFDVFPAGAQTIYYYYGNPNATDGFTPAAKTGSVTQANMKMSIVANTAFVDFSAANTLTMYHGNRLVITDHTAPNKTLTGYIKAAGTAETYGGELLTDGAMENWNSPTDLTSWTESINGTGSVNQESSIVYLGTYSTKMVRNNPDGNIGYIYQGTATSGILYKTSAYVRSGTGTPRIRIGLDWNHATLFNLTTTYTQYVAYTTAVAGDKYCEFYPMDNGYNYYADNTSSVQVLTPSATGVTITSTSDGATYTWANEDGSFNRNDASGYTYTIYPLAFSTVASNYAVGALGTEEKTTGPAAYWSFDEGYGTTAYDSISNKDNITFPGSSSTYPVWKPESECVSGKCLSFDGSNDYSTATKTNVQPAQITLSTWTYLTKTDPGGSWAGMVMSNDNSSPNRGQTMYYYWSGGSLSAICELSLNGTSTFSTSWTIGSDPSPALNKWVLLTCTYDGTNIRIYANGILKHTSAPNAGSLYNNSQAYQIGARTTFSASYFQGKIDEPKIYNYARSAAQINMDYNSQMRGSNDGIETSIGGASQKWMTNGLVGNWKMDETSGTAVADASGNANTGTLTNAQETDTATAASTTTLVVPTSGASMSATDDVYNGMILNITGGGGCGITTGAQRLISDYTGASKTVTVAPAFAAEADNCTFEIRHQTGGKFGNGVGFDRGDDVALINDSNSFDNSGLITLSGWINLTAAPVTTSYIFDANQRWIVKIDSGSTLSFYDGASGFNSSAISILNSWHHIAVTYDKNLSSANIKYYLDGVQFDTDNSTRTLNNPTGNLAIGNYYSSPGVNYAFRGQIDDLRYYNRVLTPDEIQKLYNYAPGPVGQWKMDEKVSGDSKTLYDSSGNANNITTHYGANLTGMNCTVPGKFGSACQFDGVDDTSFIEGASQNGLDILSNITIETWIKPTTLTQAGDPEIISKSGDAHFYRMRFVSGGYVRFNAWGTSDSVLNNTSLLVANTWTHVAMVYDGATKRIYINGKLDASEATTGLMEYVATQRLYMGGFSGSENFNGSMDDVRIYNYARSQEQVLEDMAGDVGGGPERNGKPAAYYKFDEGYGSTAYNSGTAGTLNGTLHATPAGTNLTTTAMWDNGGKFGKAIEFDGTDDYVSIPDSDNVNDFDYNQDFSVSAWVKIPATQLNTAATYNNIIQKWYGSAGYSYVLRVYNQTYGVAGDRGKVYFARYDGTHAPVVTSTIALNDNAFHNIQMVKRGSTLYLYIDGVQNASGSDTTTTTTTNDSPVYLSNSGSGTFTGYIDEVKIFNYGLTPDDVKADYDHGSSLQLGSAGMSSTSVPSNAASQEYCVPGDPATCAGPVGEWKMNEKVSGDAKTLYDTSGSGHDGTSNDGANNTGMDCSKPGKYGTACQFDGVDDFVNLGASSNFVFTTASTMTAWVKTTNAHRQKVVTLQRGSTSTAQGLAMGEDANGNDSNDGKPVARYRNAGIAAVIGNTPINDGKWHYMAWTISGTNGILYVDGVSVATASDVNDSNTFANSADIATIGSIEVSAFSFNGTIDQVRIYDYARTPAQIAWEYNRGKPIAEYRFNECQGSAIYDYSGNGNTGTINLGADGQTVMGTCTDNANTPWYNGRSGKYGASVNFDGLSDYVISANNLGISGNAEFSMCAWINWLGSWSAGYPSFMGNNSTGSVGQGLSFTIKDGRPAIDFWNNRWRAASALTTGTWYYICGTKTPGIISTGSKIYVNGNLVSGAVEGSDSSPNITDSPAVIGRLDATRWFSGQIDDAKFFNYALSAKQVQTLYNNGAVSF